MTVEAFIIKNTAVELIGTGYNLYSKLRMERMSRNYTLGRTWFLTGSPRLAANNFALVCLSNAIFTTN